MGQKKPKLISKTYIVKRDSYALYSSYNAHPGVVKAYGISDMKTIFCYLSLRRKLFPHLPFFAPAKLSITMTNTPTNDKHVEMRIDRGHVYYRAMDSDWDCIDTYSLARNVLRAFLEKHHLASCWLYIKEKVI